jgi:hypothetical protein
MPTKKPLKPAAQVVQDYLDSLPEDKKYKECRGADRQELKNRVLPFISPEKQQKFVENPKKFDQWLTDKLKELRKFVVVPNRARKDKPLKQIGDPNGYTKEAIAAKNQKPCILASKQKYEDAHPKRMRKHHGKENKLVSQKKYRESENGRQMRHDYYMTNKEENTAKRKVKRQQELEKELQDNPDAMTPEDIDVLVESVYNEKGFIPEIGSEYSLMDLLNEKKIITYFGLCFASDRFEYERLRWLVTTDHGYRPVLEWDQGPFGTARINFGEAIDLLGFKSIVLYKKALDSGMEAYMVEREFQLYQEHMELGYQKLNRVPGAGHPFRGSQAVYQVFMTYASSDVFETFPNLKIMK